MPKPIIPQVGVSGATQNINWMVWRNAVIDGLAGRGCFDAEGLDGWARRNIDKLQLRYGLGLSPEDAVRDFVETWPKPYLQDDRQVIRRAVEDAKRKGHWNKDLPK